MVKVFSSGAVIGALMLTEFVKGTEVDIIKLSDGLPVGPTSIIKFGFDQVASKSSVAVLIASRKPIPISFRVLDPVVV